MVAHEFIDRQEVFEELRSEGETIIDTEKRLPDFVFRRPFETYFAIEYTHVYGGKFGNFLSDLSRIFGDERIQYMTLDPDATEYHDKYSIKISDDSASREEAEGSPKRGKRLSSQRGLPFWGMASFRACDVKTRYCAVLTREKDEGFGLLDGVNIGVFWGSSLKWGIYCDRIAWETAVIAVSGNIDVHAMTGFWCMDASGISGYMKSQYHWNLPVAKDFNERFLANYPI